MVIEIVDLPIKSMVDLSHQFFVSLPEGSNGISLRNGAFSDHHYHFFTGVPQFGITKLI